MKQREIKFRQLFEYGPSAEEITGTKWVVTALGQDGVFRGGGFVCWSRALSPVVEFTGIHDRQGKDIYEGDLITNKSGRVCVVEWHPRSGSWDATPTNDKGDSLWFLCMNWPQHITVIGSIYELLPTNTTEVR